MARYTGPVVRLYRREGKNLHLKSARSAAQRRAMENINTPPGQHGKTNSKLSTYGVQLREKQSLRRIYGVLERQFRRYIVKCEQWRGVSGHVLLQLLESRLDNVAFRCGYASTRAQARQFVSHKHIAVNGECINIPSYHVKPGDKISLTPAGAALKYIQENLEYAKSTGRKGWIEWDDATQSAKFLQVPERDQLDDIDVREQLIIELYSK